ncbi:MAG: hypothetical protein ACOVSR_04315 [Bacteroidia bacterium]
MKNTLSIIATCLLFSLLQLNCKRSPTDNIRVNVNTDIFNSPMLIRFVNANENSVDQPSNFTVKISGKDAALVVSSDGSTNFNAVGGVLTLAINSKTNASVSAPINFTITANITGFAPIVKTISLVNNEPVQYTFSALELANPTDGTVITSNQTAVTNGIVNSTFEIITPKRAEMPESSTLTIPTGTQLLDKDGKAISASMLTTNIVFYGTGDQSSINAFPGGLEPKDVIGADGNTIDGGVNFMTAGMLSINMNAGGTEVKSFSKPIAAAVELNANQDNFATGQPIKEGDSIPVWSMDETTGQWKYESQAIVTNVGGKLKANFNITHLSGWNLDWGWSSFGGYNSCNSQLKVKTLTTVQGGNYEVTLTTPNGNYLGALHGTTIFNGFIANFTRTPVIANAKIVISDNNDGGKVVAESPLFNPCTKGSLDIIVPGKPATDYVNVVVKTQGVCSKQKVNANIGVWMYLNKIGSNNWFVGFYNSPNNIGSLVLENNSTYRLYAIYGNKLYFADIPLNKNNFTFPNISGLSGTANYNSSTNTLTINGTFVLPGC